MAAAGGGEECRAESVVLGRVHIDRHPGVEAFFGLFQSEGEEGEGERGEGGRGGGEGGWERGGGGKTGRRGGGEVKIRGKLRE